MKLIDISTDLMRAKRVPMEPEPRLQKLNRMDCGDACDTTALYTSLHTGTHVDAASFIQEEEEEPPHISDLPLETFIGPVTVVSVPEGPVTGEVIENYLPRNAERIIIRGPFWEKDVTFFGGAAKDLADIGYKLIGFEGAANNGDEDMSLYYQLMANGAVVLEGLDLSKVERDGDFFLMAQPLKLEGTEAALCRAVLVEDQLFWASRDSRLHL